jgi:hypothetical protein
MYVMSRYRNVNIYEHPELYSIMVPFWDIPNKKTGLAVILRFYSYTQSLQPSAVIVLKTGHNHILPISSFTFFF